MITKNSKMVSWRINSKIMFLTLAIVLLCLPFALATTTPGALDLKSTFESISVRASYSGDPGEDNSAAVQFRMVGSSTWKDAYTPFIDRGVTSGSFADEARVSIVGGSAGGSTEADR